MLSGVQGVSPHSGRRRRRGDEGRCDPRSSSSSTGDSPWTLSAPTDPLGEGRAVPQPCLHPGRAQHGWGHKGQRDSPVPVPGAVTLPGTDTTCGEPWAVSRLLSLLLPPPQSWSSPEGVTARWPRGRAAVLGTIPGTVAPGQSPAGARTCGRSTPRLVAWWHRGHGCTARVTCWHPLVTALHPPLLSSLIPCPFLHPPAVTSRSPPPQVTPRPPPRVTFPASSPRVTRHVLHPPPLLQRHLLQPPAHPGDISCPPLSLPG